VSKLDPSRIHAILLDSLFKDDEITEGEIPANSVICEGVIKKVRMNRDRLELHKQEVREMLDDLPDNFKEEIGGGWSFLNACMDKYGNQWRERVNIDELLIIAQGLKLVTIQFPREAWPLLPGAMPYFSVNTQEPRP
jgi:hypothetical protein